ncbi:hypothetical protein D3C73_1011590 [compost metagenome]
MNKLGSYLIQQLERESAQLFPKPDILLLLLPPFDLLNDGIQLLLRFLWIRELIIHLFHTLLSGFG